MGLVYNIYRYTNIVNGKIYIGFSQDVYKRDIVHVSSCKKENTKFYRALRKYGRKNFILDIIYQSKDRDHCLKVMEPYFIWYYDSKNNGYNSTLGGDGCFGMILSEEARNKISEKNKIKKPTSGNRRERTEEEKIKISERFKGKKRSKEFGEKISLALKGKKKSKEHVESMKKRPQDTMKLVCPHCGKEGDFKNMKRWHMDRCKFYFHCLWD